MGKYDWTAAIKANIFCFKLLGLWPKGKSYEFNLYAIYSLIFFTVFCFTHSVLHVIMSLTNLMDTAAITAFMSITELVFVLKIFCFAGNIKVFKELIVALDSELFQPSSGKQIMLVSPTVNAWKVIYRMIYVTSTLDVIVWLMMPFLDGTYKQWRLPFPIWYPYDYHNTLFYTISYLHQTITFITLGSATVNLNALIAALCIYSGAQLDILCDNLRKIRSERFQEELVRCVQHHREIVNFVETFNKSVVWIFLLEFLVIGLSLGFSMFFLTIVKPFSGQFYSFLCFSTALILEIFTYCWFGNEVHIKSMQVPFAAYESSWIEASLGAKKDLLFFMMQTQRELKLSVWSLSDLSLETLLKILKTSGSYYTVMNQRNA